MKVRFWIVFFQPVDKNILPAFVSLSEAVLTFRLLWSFDISVLFAGQDKHPQLCNFLQQCSVAQIQTQRKQSGRMSSCTTKTHNFWNFWLEDSAKQQRKLLLASEGLKSTHAYVSWVSVEKDWNSVTLAWKRLRTKMSKSWNLQNFCWNIDSQKWHCNQPSRRSITNAIAIIQLLFCKRETKLVLSFHGVLIVVAGCLLTKHS